MVTATIFEAKTNLSELVRRAQAGEEVIITSGRDKKPVVRLQAVEPAPEPKRLGIMYDPNFRIPDSFWDPLSDEECGLAEHRGDPLFFKDPA